MIPHPPKPRLTVRIGVTGHRPNKLADEVVPRTRAQLRDTFAAIERAAAEIHAENTTFYAAHPPLIRLLSGFAEGADQFAVEESPSGWQIGAILPFPREEYLEDFTHSPRDGSDTRPQLLASLAKAASVTELPRRQPGARDQGYAEAGAFMLRQIDLLIAVWDGFPPRRGGTGAVARQACAEGIPVIWISTREDRHPLLIAGFDEQGAPVVSPAALTEHTIATALEAAFSVPARATRIGSGSIRLADYLREQWPRRFSLSAYDVLCRLAGGRLPRFALIQRSPTERAHDWSAFLQSAPQVNDLREGLIGILLPRAAWADALAVHYSHLFRSAYVLAYALAALAVFVGVATVFIHNDPQTPANEVLAVKAVFTGIELLLIGAIVALVWLGRRRAWHRRWLDYRALAELLRHGRFLAFMAEFGAMDQRRSTAATHWTIWYSRATMREIGIPTATLDERYQQGILRATLAEEIAGEKGQLAYHAANREEAHRIDHVLHLAGTACFLLTGVILLAFLAAFAVESFFGIAGLEKFLLGAKPYLTFASASLPALGAAVAGIRAHADFEGSAGRSARMVERLERLKEEYAEALTQELTLETTADLLIATAGALSEDVSGWQELYGRKRLVLPA
jgi:hypothetical protein